MQILFLLIKARLWLIIERPEKEHKKLISASFRVNGALTMQISFIPVVISINPSNKAESRLCGMFNIDSMLFISEINNIEFFSMFINTAKINIKPITHRVVFIALSIAFLKFSPKEEVVVFSKFFLIMQFEEVFFFVIMAIIITDR